MSIGGTVLIRKERIASVEYLFQCQFNCNRDTCIGLIYSLCHVARNRQLTGMKRFEFHWPYSLPGYMRRYFREPVHILRLRKATENAVKTTCILTDAWNSAFRKQSYLKFGFLYCNYALFIFLTPLNLRIGAESHVESARYYYLLQAGGSELECWWSYLRLLSVRSQFYRL